MTILGPSWEMYRLFRFDFYLFINFIGLSQGSFQACAWQWEKVLLCNASFHWLSPYPEGSLCHDQLWIVFIFKKWILFSQLNVHPFSSCDRVSSDPITKQLTCGAHSASSHQSPGLITLHSSAAQSDSWSWQLTQGGWAAYCHQA